MYSLTEVTLAFKERQKETALRVGGPCGFKVELFWFDQAVFAVFTTVDDVRVARLCV